MFMYISAALKFQKYTETPLLAQFDKDVPAVQKMTLKFSTGNSCSSKSKLRVLKIRLTNLERKERWATTHTIQVCAIWFQFRSHRP